uniref:FtsX-like permease family protein n=1 Tax=Streptomyces sp. SBT349 TaxID=1580539 RepID=UPI00066AD3B7
GLRPGVVLTLLALTVPVLELAGQCARLGAPARERRLAALRLAGATPRQTAAVAAAETGAAALVGAVAGLGVHLAGRELLHRPAADGRLPLPTDVLPHPLALAAVVLVLPLAAVLAAALMTRRVAVDPLGASRRSGRQDPRPWPAALIVLGALPYLVVLPMTGRNGAWPLPALLLVGAVLVTLGVACGAAWISWATGRVLHRVARRPAELLAARALMADPWSGSRAFGALLAAVVFGAGALAVRAYFVAAAEAEATFAGGDDFYVRSLDLVNLAVLVALVVAAGGLLVALAEGVLSRRRDHAALLAAGVPRGVLVRALAWRALAPAVPAVALALTMGTLLGRALFGTEPDAVLAGAEVTAVPAELPLAGLALLTATALALLLATTATAALCLRATTTPDELRSA